MKTKETEEHRKSVGTYVIGKFDKLKGQRTNWDNHWDEVSHYFIPKKDGIYGKRTRGDQRHDLIYDATPIHSVELLASALHGMLTNPTSVWFGLSTGDTKLDSNDNVRAWLEDSAKRIIQVLNNSNFQTEIHEVYIDLCSFGTSPMRIEEDDDSVVRFHARPIYEAFIAENYKNLVDTVHYEYEMTLDQILEQFGPEVFDDEMERDRIASNGMKRETVVHAVEPRRSANVNVNIPEKMPFASYHVLRRTKMLLKESGFKENPYAVARWSKLSGEVYGRSPAMKSLPDAKMLNKMKKATIEAAQLAVAPPLQVPDDGVLLPIRTTPNSVNYYRAGTKDRIEALQTNNDVRLGETMMQTVREQIMKSFFIDQLQMGNLQRATTLEISQRRDESLRLLSPILGRMNHELLRPMIDRVFSVMMRKNMFDAAPAELDGMELEVQYTSMLAKAQLSAEGDNFMRFLSAATPVMQVQPEAADKLDGDESIDYLSTLYGVPHRVIRKDDDVQMLRKGRAEADQEMAARDKEAHDAEVANKTQGLGEQGA